ncbi:MAG TPA: FtsX-like permease family protein [Candidatus Kapabacteria bacterium]|nr:FtsX-like permease family protein [Candidatus Kapabacteria bacterium]
MLIAIAWRNVWRNTTRSGVVIAAIAVGLWAGIFSDAFMQGMAGQFIYSSIHTETGHIQLCHPGFLLNHDVQDTISRSDSILAAIRRMPSVTGAAQSIQMFSLASKASFSTGIMLNGIVPEEEKNVSDLYTDVVKGSYFGEDRPNQIVIGQKLAEQLHANVHSKIVLTLQTVSGDIIYGAFRVCGIYHTYNTDYEGNMAFVNIGDVRRLAGFTPNTASIIKVLLNQSDIAQDVSDTLQHQFPALKVQPWMTISPLLTVMSGWIKQIALAFVLIILLALAFGIINTMLMAVIDRTRELGMLMAVGMKPGQVFRMVVMETVFLALTGAVVGTALSVATVLYFGHAGIDLSIIAEELNSYGYSTMVYPSLGLDFYLQLAVLVFAIAVLSSILPARRATRLNPVEALQGD